MYSLYHLLLAQHPRQLTPVCCAESTISQLHRCLEDVVLENNLGALVIESLPISSVRSAREYVRLNELDQTARNLFLLISPNDTLASAMLNRGKGETSSVTLTHTDQEQAHERFVVIADTRFAALVASIHSEKSSENAAGDLVIWTFEPDVVYSALEYLMARVTAEHPFHATSFADAVRVSMPKATSMQLTLRVVTKLARLLQEQSEREIAVNRLATTIRNSLEIDSVLQTAANEVGRSLNVTNCVVCVGGTLLEEQKTEFYFHPDIVIDDSAKADLSNEIASLRANLSKSPQKLVVDGDSEQASGGSAYAVVPLIYQGGFLGLLRVQSDDSSRVWADNELLLLQTVADQLAVAVNQANLFAQMQREALTDSLTGCYNRRQFEMQLERDLHLATRNRQPLSLLILDLDNFKEINDQAGHDAGDLALRLLADSLRAELRAVDTAARYGGDEFLVILPQASVDGALIVAERLRARIEQTEVPGFGQMTASFGLASFPTHASSRDTLVVAADRALYISKNAGRNRVSLPPEEEAGNGDLPHAADPLDTRSFKDTIQRL